MWCSEDTSYLGYDPTLVRGYGLANVVYQCRLLGILKHEIIKTAVQHTPSKSVLDNQEQLSKPFLSIPIVVPPPPIDIHLFVDTSESWGVGL